MKIVISILFTALLLNLEYKLCQSSSHPKNRRNSKDVLQCDDPKYMKRVGRIVRSYANSGNLSSDQIGELRSMKESRESKEFFEAVAILLETAGLQPLPTCITTSSDRSSSSPSPSPNNTSNQVFTH